MEKICPICGNKFFIESLKSRKKYCSTECFNKYYVDYKRKRAKEYNKKNRVPGTEYYKKHLDYNRQYLKKYNQLESTKEKKENYELNSNRKEYIKQYQKKYRETPARKEYLKQYMKEYSKKPEVIEKRKEYLRKYLKVYFDRSEVIEKRKEYLKKYNNTPDKKKYLKKYHNTPEKKDRLKKYRTKYSRERRKNDPTFRLMYNLRGRFKSFLKLSDFKKSSTTMTLIGCSPFELRSYIEKQFKPGMSWENYGVKGWHIDHKKPLALAKSMQEIIDGNYMHYTNFQPLWAEENIRKSDKYIDN